MTEFESSAKWAAGRLGQSAVRVRVPAKVNLALRVARRGEDGFHQLATVFQAVELFDQVTAQRRSDTKIQVRTSGLHADRVADDHTNLAVRAAAALRDRFGTPDLGVSLSIEKSIPVAGGMAGGSADAAGALLACSTLWQLSVSNDELYELGAELGSDIPFALLGGTALGLGRGTDVTPVLTGENYYWVLALSHRGLSTPSVYQHFDQLVGQALLSPSDVNDPSLSKPVIDALTSGQATQLAAVLVNDLQEPACQLRPELREVLAAGTRAGALAGIVSGSGPSCAFLCASPASSQQLAASLAELEQVSSTLCVRAPASGAQLWAR